MAAVKYIGRTTDFKGKTLWELVGNLKNFGIGRVVVRNMFCERYSEPSFMKIVKVEALPNEENRKVKVTVEKTFRGRKYPKLVEIESSSYKTDYQLLSKTEEDLYCKTAAESVEKILAPTIELPPLLRAFIEKETNQKNPTTAVIIKQSRDNVYRLARDGENPNAFLELGVGKPTSMKFYEGLDLKTK